MNCLVYKPIGHIDVERLRADFPQHVFHLADDLPSALRVCGACEVLIALAHFVDDDLVAAMPRLRWLCSLTSGVDHLWTLRALKDDVRITTGRGIHGPQMAELAFLYMLALSRRLDRMMEDQRNHVWERRPQALLLHKTLVIVGVGAIGEDLALRAKAFGMTVIGVSDARASANGFDDIVARADLAQAAGCADFLVVLVPLTDETRHMIDARILSAMKPTAALINIARGPVVDEQALIAHLRDGRIAGAGLDVFETEPLPADSPLWSMPNVYLTPRIGGMSDVYDRQIHPLVAHNLRCWLAGKPEAMRNIAR